MEGPGPLEDDEVRDLGQEAAWSLSSAKQGNGALVLQLLCLLVVVVVLLIVFPGSAFFLGTVGFLFLRVKGFLHGNSCEGKRIYGVTEREACIFSGTVGFRNWSVDKVG